MTKDTYPINAARMRRAARCLGRRERAVLMLSAAQGLDLESVAALLGLDPAEAERLLADAIFKLGQALERDRRPWWRFW